MMRKEVPVLLLFFILSGMLMISCGGGVSESNDNADSVLYIPRVELATNNELKGSTGRTWIVHQTPMLDSSLVNVAVEVRGISGDTISIDFGEIDPVAGLYLEDLDNDGYEELYVVTESAGPEKSGTIYGLYAERDEMISLISYEGPTPYTMKEGEPYEGYRGHDMFRFDKGVLTNTIPVFNPEDPEDKPSLGSRTVTYELVKGQSIMRLRPRRIR